MTSKIDISNMALSFLGLKPITSMDETTPEAVKIKSVFDSVVFNVVRAYPWSCLRKRVTLAKSGDADKEGMSPFRLPTDFARLLDSTDANGDYIIRRGSFVWSKQPNLLSIEYIRLPVDFSEVNDCAEVMAYELAIVLCMPITQSQTLKDSLIRDKVLAENRARESNAFELPPDDLPEAPWVIARE